VAATSVFIPTPDASTLISDYTTFYDSSFRTPKSYIGFSSVLDDVIGCPYNMDQDDDEWLARAKADNILPNADFDMTDDLYETIIWTMERLANEKVKLKCYGVRAIMW
jgi:hypothetical protein